MIYIFYQPVFQAAADGYKIKHGKVLYIFAETYSTGMGTNRDIKFRCHQQDRQDFIHPANPAAVDLTYMPLPASAA